MILFQTQLRTPLLRLGRGGQAIKCVKMREIVVCFSSKRGQVIANWNILHNEELCFGCKSLSIVKGLMGNNDEMEM
jgi:hypothetical protein